MLAAENGALPGGKVGGVGGDRRLGADLVIANGLALEEGLLDVLGRVAKRGITRAELQRAKTQVEVGEVKRLKSNPGLGDMGDRLFGTL